MRNRFLVRLFAASLTLLWGIAVAADANASKSGGKADAKIPKAESSITAHTVSIDGKTISYKATVGTLIVRGKEDKPIASFGYTAYVKTGVTNPARRPIMFAYNGGPGSSSIWLHMGVLGPRRVVVTDGKATPPPPYKVVNNAFSIIDRTDLVMIDPVGTGFSKPVGKAKGKDFWGVDQDIESVSRFIKEYVNENDRWSSPKYLLGESYGTMRSAGVVDYLQSNEGMAFNGVVLVSSFLDARTAIQLPGNDQAFIMFLPTYAAVAWFHDVIPNKEKDLVSFLKKVRDFANGEYAAALMKGDTLAGAERKRVIAKMAGFTGLSPSYIDKANLRVSEGQFTKELLRSQHKTVGRLDSRFTGISFNLLGEQASYDPQSVAISPAYTASFLDYLHRELKFGKDKTYRVMGDLFMKWDFRHRSRNFPFPIAALPNTAPDLAHALGTNPFLQVIVLNGYYDLATPFMATEYTVAHMGLEPSERKRISMKYYRSGHMMYLHRPSLKKFKHDVAEFIDRTDRL